MVTMTTACPPRFPSRSVRVPPAGELDRFRAVQRLAYQGAEAVAATLRAGVTERQAARRLRTWLEGEGVDDWFHLPFAWFGDRTAFRTFRTPLQFLPTGRRLEPGMGYILDAAPVVAGATADIGFTGSLGANPATDQIMDDLAAHRALILQEVRAGRTFQEVYEAVDRLAAEQGYANRHHQYPGHVIGHLVEPLDQGPGQGLTPARFGRRHLRSLARTIAVGRREHWSPLWSGDRRSAHPAVPGLWAMEPHLGLRGAGAKFEELLVITEDDAYWLDDDLPHVRRWAQRGVTDGGSA
jgi:Xaa-Pro aminopeptidase